MQFGPTPLDQALGTILAHSVAGLRKGALVDAAAMDHLRAAGLTEVITARLAPDDLHEDAAALQIAQSLAAPGLRLGGVGTGRVNLYATGPGLLRVNATQVHALNRVNPMITLATLPHLARVAEGTMLATIKIIAYAVPAAYTARAAATASGALSLAPPQFQSASLIETSVGPPLPAKGRDAIRTRLARLGLTLTDRVICPHATAPLAQAIATAPGQIVLILTASATSDPADIGPSALVTAGGDMTRFGMPVDPGNLLFFGQLGQKPVIGLPGCARSPALNGADWVMERLICGLPVTADDVAAMGAGGLLKEPPSRPRSRVQDSQVAPRPDGTAPAP